MFNNIKLKVLFVRKNCEVLSLSLLYLFSLDIRVGVVDVAATVVAQCLAAVAVCEPGAMAALRFK